MRKYTYTDKLRIAHTEICTVCEMLFVIHQGWPREVCTPCRIDDTDLQKQIQPSALSRPVDKIAYKTLTVEQWVYTLKYFNGRCAYCRKAQYACLEHFVPLCLGGSTSMSNVVPGCLSCNALKRNIHPAFVKTIPQADIERVCKYLQQFI